MAGFGFGLGLQLLRQLLGPPAPDTSTTIQSEAGDDILAEDGTPIMTES